MSAFRKYVVVGLAALLTGAVANGSARAQDTQYDWDGWWAGAGIGWKWVDTNFRANPNDFAAPPAVAAGVNLLSPGSGVLKRGDLSLDGFTVGGLVGVNMRDGNWIYSLEADADFVDADDAKTRSVDSVADYSVGTGGQPDFANRSETCRHKKDMWFEASLAGRLGYLVSPTTQVFLRGGLAAAAVEHEVDCLSTIQFIDNVGALLATHTTRAKGKDDAFEFGYTLGAGIVHVIDEDEGKWRLRFDYAWVDLGSNDQTVQITRTTTNAAIPNTGPSVVKYDWEEDYHKIRLSLIYKFGDPPPPPLK